MFKSQAPTSSTIPVAQESHRARLALRWVKVSAQCRLPIARSAQYELTLSLGAKTVNGVAYASTCQLTTVLKDVANTTYTGLQSPTYKSYNDPAAGSPAWYRPSTFADSSSTSPAYNGSVASVSSSGLVTALAVGESIVEVQYPTFDFTSSPLDPEPSQATGDPVMMVYCQIRVVVIN